MKTRQPRATGSALAVALCVMVVLLCVISSAFARVPNQLINPEAPFTVLDVTAGTVDVTSTFRANSAAITTTIRAQTGDITGTLRAGTAHVTGTFDVGGQVTATTGSLTATNVYATGTLRADTAAITTTLDVAGKVTATSAGIQIGKGVSAGEFLTVSNNTGTLTAGGTGTLAHFASPDGVALRVLMDAFAANSSIDYRRANTSSASKSALLLHNILGQFTWQGYGATGYGAGGRATIRCFAAENWTDSAQGVTLSFSVAPIGSAAAVEQLAFFSTGLTATVPIQGTDFYKTGGSAYTNPDYVAEHWATGSIHRYELNEGAAGYHRLTLAETEAYVREHWRLPGIDDHPMPIFRRSDIALEKIEEVYLHLFDLKHEVTELRRLVLVLLALLLLRALASAFVSVKRTYLSDGGHE